MRRDGLASLSIPSCTRARVRELSALEPQPIAALSIHENASTATYTPSWVGLQVADVAPYRYLLNAIRAGWCAREGWANVAGEEAKKNASPAVSALRRRARLRYRAPRSQHSQDSCCAPPRAHAIASLFPAATAATPLVCAAANWECFCPVCVVSLIVQRRRITRVKRLNLCLCVPAVVRMRRRVHCRVSRRRQRVISAILRVL